MRLCTRSAAPVAALGLTLVLTGCGANFQAQTYQERTVADATNVAVGAIAVRNLGVVPPESGELYEAGDDAEVRVTLTNDGPEPDQLVEVTSPDAREVVFTEDGDDVSEVDLPRLGTTGGLVGLRLEGLTEDLRPGDFVTLTLRFERNGEITTSAPVALTGEFDADERERSENFHEIGEHEGEGEG